jgi:hypothetical protein
VQESEQQSPNLEHVWPAPLHTAAGVPVEVAPPQNLLEPVPEQFALQQSALELHDPPLASQLGATQVPPAQLPVQQSAPVVHA